MLSSLRRWFEWSSKVREVVFEEKRQTVSILIVLNRTDVSIAPDSVVIPDEPIVNQLVETDIEFLQEDHNAC